MWRVYSVAACLCIIFILLNFQFWDVLFNIFIYQQQLIFLIMIIWLGLYRLYHVTNYRAVCFRQPCFNAIAFIPWLLLLLILLLILLLYFGVHLSSDICVLYKLLHRLFITLCVRLANAILYWICWEWCIVIHYFLSI